MAATQPYYYKRSSRGWVNVLFFACGAILLLLGLVEFRFGRLNLGRDPLIFFFALGGVFCFGGAAGLLTERVWEMQIDEYRLSWKDGKRGGEIPVGQIKGVQVKEGDFRCMIVEMLDGARHTIPGECYGDASDLRAWLRDHFGNALEVLN